MRMMPLLSVVVAMGLAMMILGGLGVSDYFGDDQERQLENEVADEANEDRSLEPESGDDGGFFSFVIGALGTLRDLMGLAVFLPSTLQSFGLPFVVARAIGHGIQLVIAVGIAQVAIQWEVK